MSAQREAGSDAVLTEASDGVLLITLNRPEARNAVNAAVARGVAAALDRLDAEDELRVAILTGAGSSFCAGMDLKAFVAGERPYAEGRGFAVEVDEVSEGKEAGILSATFIVKGRYAYGLLRSEQGVHRLVRMSPFDAAARRQTSFASLNFTPFTEDASGEVDLDEKDLRVDTYRSSGAGGQHVNVTDSAVRITHLPTGVVVSCQNERSQTQNKARAMQVLVAKLIERQREERRAALEGISGTAGPAAMGNQIRSYVQAPYQLVKDLRTAHETGNVQAVLEGDLDGFMESFLRWERSTGA